jgi:pimeloyl-ACP methyl ester carboxylesterase
MEGTVCTMPVFAADDGTELAYRIVGNGLPIICLPGGPMRASEYLGDLGGLSSHRQLVMLDLRGTGASSTPEDVGSYRCDRLVNDVEALREHLALERIDLLAHSAGANLAVLYAASHPDRIGKLVLVTPSTHAVAIEITASQRLEAARRCSHEPWFADAFAALKATTTGTGSDEDWAAITPFFYVRWDAAAQGHHAAEVGQQNNGAAVVFGADGAFTPSATRAALATLRAPVLLVAGEADVAAPPVAMAAYSDLFSDARLVIQHGAGHYPWLNDSVEFAATVSAFLA